MKIRPISANHPKNDCETVAHHIHIQLLLSNKQTHPTIDRSVSESVRVVDRKFYGGTLCGRSGFLAGATKTISTDKR